VTIAQVGKVLRIPAVVVYDTENAGITNRVVYPLAHSVCTPSCYEGDVNGTQVTYPSYHEFAYLHPNRFTPDASVVERNGINPTEPYFIVRLVSWQASHDIGEAGLGPEFIRKLVDILQPHGRVLITSEGGLPDDLTPLCCTFPPQDMHQVIAHAQMLIGESATMASEAAVLGVPAVYAADTGRGYTNEQDREYGLVKNFKRNQGPEVLDYIREVLANPEHKAVIAEGHQRMLNEKIDTTQWMIDYLDGVVQNQPA